MEEEGHMHFGMLLHEKGIYASGTMPRGAMLVPGIH
jgi:hypothetical protein